MLDEMGASRLRRLQEVYGETYFQDVPPQRGADDDQNVSVTLDAALRFVEVTVHNFDGVAGSSRSVRAAFAGAYAEADGRRAMLSGEMSPRRDELAERAEAVHNGTFVWPTTRRYIGPSGNQWPAAQKSRPRPDPPKIGRARNGHVSVELPAGRVGSMCVNVDEDWLARATSHDLQSGIREAIEDAGEWF
ncbi:hypothetical protein ACFVDI_00155 [Nocardioides sp. NPDC057767]|uniref:hypothetical protein n=1 Tax=unclassified Nocardioides TaxID=2615069 RepID=UPI00366AA310